MRVVAETRVAAAPAVVFAWIADPEKAMRWQHDVVEQEILSATPGFVGTQFREVVADGGGRLEIRGTITRFVDSQTIGFHLVSRIHELDVAYATEEMDGATRVSVEANVRWKSPMNVIALVAGRRMQASLAKQLRLELAELKTLVEWPGTATLAERQ